MQIQPLATVPALGGDPRAAGHDRFSTPCDGSLLCEALSQRTSFQLLNAKGPQEKRVKHL
jgi:hypothetical protein